MTDERPAQCRAFFFAACGCFRLPAIVLDQLLPMQLYLPPKSPPASWLSSLGRGLLRALAWFAGLSLLSVLLLAVVNPPLWGWRLERALLPPAGYPEKVRHQWVSLEQISPQLQLAVIAAEDQRFPDHLGFDLRAMAAAAKHNERSSRLRGASTLSQQAAKNLFLCSWRSYLRKGLEAWFTLLMELLWSKERLLEVYLNIVEFGPGIYGAEAASRAYFGRSAAQLTGYQAARLAAVLPNPYRFSAARPSAYVEQRSRWILRQMNQLGLEWLERL